MPRQSYKTYELVTIHNNVARLRGVPLLPTDWTGTIGEIADRIEKINPLPILSRKPTARATHQPQRMTIPKPRELLKSFWHFAKTHQF